MFVPRLTRLAFACLFLICSVGICAGQSFTNLGFEQAVVQSHDPMFGFLDWNLAVPGWSHTDGADTDSVYYGYSHVGVTQWFMLVDANNSTYRPLNGRYSIAFQSGYSDPGGGAWVNASIYQTALIPAAARSVRFMATGNFGVAVDGIAPRVVSVGANTYAADISRFSGSVHRLSFTNLSQLDPYWMNEPVLVDGISFSPIAIVPEPSGLLALGGGVVGLLGLVRRRL